MSRRSAGRRTFAAARRRIAGIGAIACLLDAREGLKTLGDAALIVEPRADGEALAQQRQRRLRLRPVQGDCTEIELHGCGAALVAGVSQHREACLVEGGSEPSVSLQPGQVTHRVPDCAAPALSPISSKMARLSA